MAARRDFEQDRRQDREQDQHRQPGFVEAQVRPVHCHGQGAPADQGIARQPGRRGHGDHEVIPQVAALEQPRLADGQSVQPVQRQLVPAGRPPARSPLPPGRRPSAAGRALRKRRRRRRAWRRSGRARASARATAPGGCSRAVRGRRCSPRTPARSAPQPGPEAEGDAQAGQRERPQQQTRRRLVGAVGGWGGPCPGTAAGRPGRRRPRAGRSRRRPRP